MDPSRLVKRSELEWEIPRRGRMRVPGVLFASATLVEAMDEKVFEQLSNVATLPGIVTAAYAMPDAHWGYGFPIGGVAAFDPEDGGVVSAGGVGFDISCGVRCLHTGMKADDLRGIASELADVLFRRIPAGVGSTGAIRLSPGEMQQMLAGGARWAVERGWGSAADLDRIEESGQMKGARPECVSEDARRRQRDEMGTLGSGNHYLEIQRVAEIHDAEAARVFGLAEGDAVVAIHCGSRGLGHQIGTEFLRAMALAAPSHGLSLPDRELACAPIDSDLGRDYLSAMRAAINCALANRQILTHLAREAFDAVVPGATLRLVYDVSHNTCKEESHVVDGRRRRLFVHRKGATRAFGPGHPDVPGVFRSVGQPVLIGGSMGTSSFVLVGTKRSEERAFSSACHGAGRAMSRHQATRIWSGRTLIDALRARGVEVRGGSMRGLAEEAPGAYKDVTAVVHAAHEAGLATMVARLEPMVCIKG